MARLALDETKVFVADTADARAKNAGDNKIFVLAIVILAAFALLVIGVLTVVLAKPELEELPIPALLLEPLGRQLPFDVPNR